MPKVFYTVFYPNSSKFFVDLFLGMLIKNFLNRLKTLRKHLFSLLIDEENNIFNFRLYRKKLPLL